MKSAKRKPKTVKHVPLQKRVDCRSTQQAVYMSTSTQHNMAQFLIIEGADCIEQLNAYTQLMVQDVQLNNKLWSILICTSEFKISYFKNDQYE